MSSCTTVDNKNAVSGLMGGKSLLLADEDFVHLKADYLGIKVTDEAKKEIFVKLSKKTTAKGIRISVVTKGCSGLSYKMEYAESSINITQKDEIIELNDGIKIFVDPKSSLFLFGMIIDYQTDGIQSGFKFENPTSKGACGCGESFFV